MANILAPMVREARQEYDDHRVEAIDKRGAIRCSQSCRLVQMMYEEGSIFRGSVDECFS